MGFGFFRRILSFFRFKYGYYKSRFSFFLRSKNFNLFVKNGAVDFIALSRFSNNPLIAPHDFNEWENWQTFNPGAVLIDGKVHLLYRAIGSDGVSRLGYAVSSDGFSLDLRVHYPVYEHFGGLTFSFSGGSLGGCEDPRLVFIKDDGRVYMTYTYVNGGLMVALTSISVDDFINRRWNWSEPRIISNPETFNKNWVIFPEKINGKYAVIHSINPRISIEYLDDLDFSDGGFIDSYYGGSNSLGDGWDSLVRGVGAPPVKTKHGWLLFYHAMTKGHFDKYKVGVMLLDLNNPSKVLCKAKMPVLEPKEYHELNGFKPGVVYASGAVVKNDKLIVYYGGADSYVCVASADLDKFISQLKSDVKPSFKFNLFRGRRG